MKKKPRAVLALVLALMLSLGLSGAALACPYNSSYCSYNGPWRVIDVDIAYVHLECPRCGMDWVVYIN